MKCFKCGTDNAMERILCVKCGNRLRAGTLQITNIAQPETPVARPQPFVGRSAETRSRMQRRRREVVALVVVTLALMAGLMLLTFLLSR